MNRDLQSSLRSAELYRNFSVGQRTVLIHHEDAQLFKLSGLSSSFVLLCDSGLDTRKHVQRPLTFVQGFGRLLVGRFTKQLPFGVVNAGLKFPKSAD